MTSDDQRVPPTQQRGGTTPDAEEAAEKGPWAAQAAEGGVVPAELGGSDASPELLADDPELGSEVLGETTGSDEPATADGIDPRGGDQADATTDGGSEVRRGEPDLKDAANTQLKRQR
jgi:hypothetical protein